MKRIIVYPGLHNETDAADILSRLNWHFSPYLKYFSRLEIVSHLTKAQLGTLEAPYYLDPLSSPSQASSEFFDRLEVAPSDQWEDWDSRIAHADMVIVWRIPGEADAVAAGDPYQDLESLRAAAGETTQIVLADRKARSTEASLLLSAALSLAGDMSSVIEANRAKFQAFTETINREKCHIFGTGPSLSQVESMDFSDGDVITCNSFVANIDLMTRLQPKVICAADPIFHAGPSSYAAAFRAELIARMAEYDFTLFVPMRDYFVHLHHLPQSYHDRVIAVPYQSGPVNLDLKSDFHVAPLPNILTLLMMPIGASCYREMTISGCDGRPLHEDQYFWGHHKGSQFNDKMADIKQAHPGFFNISYNDYYTKHCDQVEEICRKFEEAGGEVSGATASFVPALRRRSAAEPLRQPRYPDRDAPLTILSLNPDLVDKVGHYWNYEAKLQPEMQARGCLYRVAASTMIGSDLVAELSSDGTAVIDGITVDPCLSVHSWTLANRIGVRTDSFEEVEASVFAEFERAIDRARAAAPGELLVYMYTGSFEHLNILYQISRDRPDVRVVVNFFWLKTADVWSPRFASKYAWLLDELQNDPRIFATAMTPHQMRALEARTGYTVPVAAHPSPLINDAEARRIIEAPTIGRSDQIRIFFPSANRVEKGSELLFDITARLVSMLRGRDYKIVFRTNPLGPDATEEEVAALGNYGLLEGHIEEEDFIFTLKSADVVVLPYLPPDFADRTSGLLIDALYAGTPVVALGGTWLAECASRHGFGRVVNIPEGEHIARAVYETALAVKQGEYDMREAARSYFSENSWAGLCDQILQNTSSDMDVYWSIEQQEQAENLRETALPLLGQVRPLASGALDILKLARNVLAPTERPHLVANGIRNAGSLIEVDGLGWSGCILEHDPILFGQVSDRLASLSQENWSLIDARPPSGQMTYRDYKRRLGFLVEVLNAPSEPRDVALILDDLDPELGELVRDWVNYSRPSLVSLNFTSTNIDRPAEVASDLAAWLHASGYQTMIAEFWHPRRVGEIGHLRRVTLAPYRPSRPNTDCQLIALRNGVPLDQLKQALASSTINCEYVETSSAEAIAERLWSAAENAQPAEVIRAYSAPADKHWELAGLTGGDADALGFVPISETDENRVHRSFVKVSSTADRPMTFSLELLRTTQRFISLWLTDMTNKVLAEATFDLELEKCVAVQSPSPLVGEDPFGGIVRIEGLPEDKTGFHVWLTVASLQTDQPVLAQLVLRNSAGSTARYAGASTNTVGVRNLMIRCSDLPAQFHEGIATQTSSSAGDQIRKAAKSLASQAMEATRTPQSTATADEPIVHQRKRVGRFGLFFSNDVGRPANEAPSRASARAAERPSTRARIGEVHDLLSLPISETGQDGWKVGKGVSATFESGKLSLNRNGAGHKDQFFTVLKVRPGMEFELHLDIAAIDPRLVVLIDGRVIGDLSYARPVSFRTKATRTEMRIDLKAVDSHYASFELVGARLEERLDALQSA